MLNYIVGIGCFDAVSHSRSVVFGFYFEYTATLGNALTYLYPALMYASICQKQNRKDQALGVKVAQLSAVLGVVMGVIGAKMAIEK
jgi:hypothetical protein